MCAVAPPCTGFDMEGANVAQDMYVTIKIVPLIASCTKSPRILHRVNKAGLYKAGQLITPDSAGVIGQTGFRGLDQNAVSIKRARGTRRIYDDLD